MREGTGTGPADGQGVGSAVKRSSRGRAVKKSRDGERSSFGTIVSDTVATYWSITRLFGPGDRNNFFYGRFSVVLVSISQLVIIVAGWSMAFGNLADVIGKGATKILYFVLIGVLAILNSYLLYWTDDRLRRQRRRFRYRPLPIAILSLFFALTIYCAAYLFS